MTLSTCGIVPRIYRLADEGLPVTLAISLHAPNDEIRNRILPSSRAFPIEDVIKAARYYFKKTGRRVTFEYILIKDVNSSLENAEELHRLLGDLNCHINLIPINGTEHIKLFPPCLLYTSGKKQGFSMEVMRSLVQGGHARFFYKKKDTYSLIGDSGQLAHKELTEEQKKACEQIIQAEKEKKFQGILLKGVTGSGKTEVYVRAADQALAMGLSLIHISPEFIFFHFSGFIHFFPDFPLFPEFLLPCGMNLFFQILYRGGNNPRCV